jgi:hypothetical protein
VGVADGISKLRPLAADITNSCHNSRILPKAVAETTILQEFGGFRQGERMRGNGSVLLSPPLVLGSAFVSRLRHLRDLALFAVVY